MLIGNFFWHLPASAPVGLPTQLVARWNQGLRCKKTCCNTNEKWENCHHSQGWTSDWNQVREHITCTMHPRCCRVPMWWWSKDCIELAGACDSQRPQSYPSAPCCVVSTLWVCFVSDYIIMYIYIYIFISNYVACQRVLSVHTWIWGLFHCEDTWINAGIIHESETVRALALVE